MTGQDDSAGAVVKLRDLVKSEGERGGGNKKSQRTFRSHLVVTNRIEADEAFPLPSTQKVIPGKSIFERWCTARRRRKERGQREGWVRRDDTFGGEDPFNLFKEGG